MPRSSGTGLLVAEVEVGEPVEVEAVVGFELDSDAGVGAVRATHWPLLQLYPIGQHALPQVFSC